MIIVEYDNEILLRYRAIARPPIVYGHLFTDICIKNSITLDKNRLLWKMYDDCQ